MRAQFPDPPKPGDPIRAKIVAIILELIRGGMIRSGKGIRTKPSSTGVTVESDGEGGVSFGLAKTGVGGIAARNSTTGVHGTASCELYSDSGTASVLSGVFVTVHNDTLATIGANKDIHYRLDPNGNYYVENVVCNP